MHFEIIRAASEFVDSDAAINQIIGDYVSSLEKMGGSCVSVAAIETTAPLFYFVVTGGVENLVLNLQKKRVPSVINEPVFLIAHPANNSLPAAMEILAKLQQDGCKGRIFYFASPDDADSLLAIKQAVQDIEVYRTLHALRLGAIGEPSDWLVASSPAPEVIRAQWGPELVPVPLSRVLALMQNSNEKELKEYASALTHHAVNIVEPSAAQIEDAVSVYTALKQIISDYELDCITVRCFDIVLQAKTTGCFALSELIDEGIVAGCEGDIMSVIGMIWSQALLRAIPWMANPSRLDENTNTLWLAHCTIPRKLLQDYTLRSHFETGLGVGIQGTLPTGPVTLLRIGGKMMDKLWICEGTLVQNGAAENLCRTQVEVKITKGGTVSDLLKAPLGNHVVVLLGHHRDRLLGWWEQMLN